MGQVTVYIEDEVEAKMRSAAKSAHLSKSKWVTNLIKEKLADEWPESFIQLAGAWEDIPTAEEIRDSWNIDTVREKL